VRTLGLGDRLRHRPSELSGGQQQRVAVARALVSKPEIVFADEPTGNLDSRAGTALLEFLQHASGDLGQTIVTVTHDAIAAAHADRVAFLAGLAAATVAVLGGSTMSPEFPPGQPAGVVPLAVVTGLKPGAVPARRAARLDVLRAIAAD
jgi:ABC-type phosphate/phosphonate transport system ATPase subunit